ncbi:hypothetical protein GCM10022226_72710 [Sphaerisporangium flaviroseum]|uniref:Uncharacterized protein n=1 Tax=Sphaerisporangium flaviroseum TaxID=509199 RepID=A0ABP7JAR8_9ACTN
MEAILAPPAIVGRACGRTWPSSDLTAAVVRMVRSMCHMVAMCGTLRCTMFYGLLIISRRAG